LDTISPIPSSTSWPAQLRAAFAIVIVVDAPRSDDASHSAEPGLDYAASGLQRLLSALADLDLPATTAWTPAALTLFPQLARNAVEAGHELALVAAPNGPEGIEASLALVSDGPVVGVVESIDGNNEFSGSSRPQTASGMSSIHWRITGVGGDWPLPSTVDDLAPAVTIPVSPYWLDRTWLSPERPLPPSSLLEAWSLALGDVRTEGGMMTIVLHPHISGRPGHINLITRFLDEVIATGDTWVATAAQIAGWWLRETDTDVD
jgi:peptidoglycan/xylan/chitin deacetylase (PgdA/CDA1 family)